VYSPYGDVSPVFGGSILFSSSRSSLSVLVDVGVAVGTAVAVGAVVVEPSVGAAVAVDPTAGGFLLRGGCGL
jgi:hypothetical protein